MIYREQGSPCGLCGAARACRHSEPAPSRQLREAIPDKPRMNTSRDGIARGTGEGRDQTAKGGGFKRYSIPRAAKRDGPHRGSV